jgi:DNA-binding CsgD family transcriptional regulator
VDTLREAVGLLRASPARLELARALVSLGGVMRRRGDRAASREPLREGHELAIECGAEGLADTARAELRASGVRIRRAPLDGVNGLTASERRIAVLAATGASNADIAHTLFLTVKTVEMHLTRTYRKLDIGGRGDLRRALGAGTGSPP